MGETVYIMATVNYYRNPIGSTWIEGVVASLESGMQLFDNMKRCAESSDYRRASWEIKERTAEKLVDHDGASVRYIVAEFKVQP